MTARFRMCVWFAAAGFNAHVTFVWWLLDKTTWTIVSGLLTAVSAGVGALRYRAEVVREAELTAALDEISDLVYATTSSASGSATTDGATP